MCVLLLKLFPELEAPRSSHGWLGFGVRGFVARGRLSRARVCRGALLLSRG